MALDKKVQKLEYEEGITDLEKEFRKAIEKAKVTVAVHTEVAEKLRQCEADLEKT